MRKCDIGAIKAWQQRRIDESSGEVRPMIVPAWSPVGDYIKALVAKAKSERAEQGDTAKNEDTDD